MDPSKMKPLTVEQKLEACIYSAKLDMDKLRKIDQQITDLTQQVKVLREVLEEYGDHVDGCHFKAGGHEYLCTCGWERTYDGTLEETK